MINTHSEDPDVELAARDALDIINEELAKLPIAQTFDYGGHNLKVGEYEVCTACTTPIAESQAVEVALRERAQHIEDETIREHVELAAQLFHIESELATIRAEFHNGVNTEQILNRLLGFEYDRHIGEDYHHSHHGGQA